MTIGDIKKMAKNSSYINDNTEIVLSSGDGGHVRIVSACATQVNGNNLKLYDEFQSGRHPKNVKVVISLDKE